MTEEEEAAWQKIVVNYEKDLKQRREIYNEKKTRFEDVKNKTTGLTEDEK